RCRGGAGREEGPRLATPRRRAVPEVRLHERRAGRAGNGPPGRGFEGPARVARDLHVVPPAPRLGPLAGPALAAVVAPAADAEGTPGAGERPRVPRRLLVGGYRAEPGGRGRRGGPCGSTPPPGVPLRRPVARGPGAGQGGRPLRPV